MRMLLFYYRQQMGESHEKAKTDSTIARLSKLAARTLSRRNSQKRRSQI